MVKALILKNRKKEKDKGRKRKDRLSFGKKLLASGIIGLGLLLSPGISKAEQNKNTKAVATEQQKEEKKDFCKDNWELSPGFNEDGSLKAPPEHIFEGIYNLQFKLFPNGRMDANVGGTILSLCSSLDSGPLGISFFPIDIWAMVSFKDNNSANNEKYINISASLLNIKYLNMKNNLFFDGRLYLSFLAESKNYGGEKAIPLGGGILLESKRFSMKYPYYGFLEVAYDGKPYYVRLYADNIQPSKNFYVGGVANLELGTDNDITLYLVGGYPVNEKFTPGGFLLIQHLDRKVEKEYTIKDSNGVERVLSKLEKEALSFYGLGGALQYTFNRSSVIHGGLGYNFSTGSLTASFFFKYIFSDLKSTIDVGLIYSGNPKGPSLNLLQVNLALPASWLMGY